MSKKDLQKEELEKVNGGVSYRPLRRINDTATAEISFCSNFKAPSYEMNNPSCWKCDNLFEDIDHTYYCTNDADDFRTIDSNNTEGTSGHNKEIF